MGLLPKKRLTPIREPAVQTCYKPQLSGFYIEPLVVLDDDILLFLARLLPLILLLWPVLPLDMLPLPPLIVEPEPEVDISEPLVLEPLVLMPPVEPLVLEPLVLEPLVEPLVLEPLVPVVVWAKATLLKQKAQAAVRNNLVVFMGVSWK